jgi:nucleoside-diphosphate-sugar epimerase
VDPKSRHKGKLETESLLETSGVNWTSIRPVYIYGPLNYNPVEEWFFHRLKAGRPIPIPGAGNQITQLGHVKVSACTCRGLWFQSEQRLHAFIFWMTESRA